MKKNQFITTLFIGSILFGTGLLLSDQAFAAPNEAAAAQEKVITETSQKLATLTNTKKQFSEKETVKKNQLSQLEESIQKLQLDLDQLAKIEAAGTILATTKHEDKQTILLTTDLIPDSDMKQSLSEKKEQLAALAQQQTTLKATVEELTAQQAKTEQQEKQLSEQLAKVKQEQVKQTDTRSAVVSAAKEQLGKPYVYGAAGPDAFDCSGLVQVAFATAGHTLGRTTVDQETAGTTIPVAEAQAGDLVFWGSHGSTYHVGISTGDGSYIHAPVPGDVVQIATVASYAPDFAVRVL